MARNVEYRADIDGLRAVAVAGVVLFHADFGWLPGGFVGVDVFFVISGFLITRILISHDGSTLSFLGHFYERRIRRLVPPALPVLAFTAAYSWFYLPPPALAELAKSAVAYAIFVSNWFFLSIAGYFDGPSHLKPLLHTWSLSVEEQFYLIFPIPVLLLMKRRRALVPAALVVVAIGSLSYSVYLVQTDQMNAAFFNSFARFWEIALGGILGTGLIKPPEDHRLRSFIGAAGLLAVVATMIFYTRETTFPGLAALPPALGATAIILSGRGPAALMLSSAPMVGLGLISYSLYLWHWPLFVLLEYAVIAVAPTHYAAAIVVALILAAGSYFLIEQPIRWRRSFNTKTGLVSAFVASTFLVSALGIAVSRADGVPSRFPGGTEYEASRIAAAYAAADARLRSECWVPDKIFEAVRRCVHSEPGKQRVLLVGDSHAAQFYPAVKRSLGDATVSLLATDACPLRSGFRNSCDELVDWLREHASSKTLPFDHVIMSSRIYKDIDLVGFSEIAELLSSVTRVTVLGPIQSYDPSLTILYPMMIDTTQKADMGPRFGRAVEDDQFRADVYLRNRFKASDVDYVSLLDVTCPNGRDSCKHFDHEENPLTIDASHLTEAAAEELIQAVSPRIRK